jgi:dihydroxyacetone kinase-like protein
LDAWRDESAKSFIEDLGSGILAIGGGSAGPLYGTLIEGFAGVLSDDMEDDAEIDAPTLKAMLAGSKEALFEITKARVGDKTMMDAWIPGVEAAQTAEGGVKAVLEAASSAAARGVAATEKMVSKFGRARSYGEQTLGAPDVGAVSAALLLEGFLRGIENKHES